MARSAAVDRETEWLEADGLGGFASGTTSGVRTRRYHALLLAAARPPADRRTLVQGFVARLVTPEGAVDFWPQAYAGGFTTGAEAEAVEFALDPWPTWRFVTRVGTVRVEVFVPHGTAAAVVVFRLEERAVHARLEVRPLLSGRDFHATHHENPVFDFTAQPLGNARRFAPYPDVPAVLSLANAEFHAAPDWYRRFYYAEEDARGLACREDLAVPGELRFDLGAGEALWVLAAELPGRLRLESEDLPALVGRLRAGERTRRAAFRDALERAGAAYVVTRAPGRTIIAGYPWFGDWGRDTFIAVRGLCLATGDLETARSILCEWAGVVSEGMLPNRFPDAAGGEREYNSVDASLWFVLAAEELLGVAAIEEVLSESEREQLEAAIVEIVLGYARGTRYGIRCDADGLLAAGERGVQLTWMDAKVGDWVVTPRIGKPVEIQALWVHALGAAGRLRVGFAGAAAKARAALEARFWNAERGMLFDVVDDGHVPGAVDPACRPNQIFAAGGLPLTLLSPERAERVIAAVERELWTPLGLRSLERGHPAYVPHFRGGVRERDGAYHQGTVWPWLIGPFVEAWVKSRGSTPAAKAEARARFIAPLRAHLERAGLEHVSEVADGDAPHTPGGCPFQAWSVSELLRLERGVLAEGAPPRHAELRWARTLA
ncbi:MAG TPA: amylo-alpha-1,6-glucosidase [Polyangiaceae bacterium]|nr:amylo-alpha-1,6-glucosidase [Polyangiaceae bacterium]